MRASYNEGGEKDAAHACRSVMRSAPLKAIAAEGLGTALLLAVVVGSGIMGERLAAGDTAMALLANSLATGAGLAVLILMYGPISGAHFNPAVTIVSAWRGHLEVKLVGPYLLAQVVGACSGVALAHAMFGEPLFVASTHVRAGASQVLSEFVATFGLISVVHSMSRHSPSVAAFAVAAYITSAYWFTASTSFANPAVTIARSLTDTFAGIRAADVPGFVLGQFAGAMVATVLCRWLLPPVSPQPPGV
jgi:glycerol uptake facilitator-like aquaporin